GTGTLAGTLTLALGLDSPTLTPPAGAAADRRTVPVEELPPVTLAGLNARLDRVGPAAAAGGLTVSVAVFDTPAKVAVMVTVFCAVTWLTLTGNDAVVVVVPKIVTSAGTVATVVSELLRATWSVSNASGAALMVTVPLTDAGPVTVLCARATEDSCGPGVTVKLTVRATVPRCAVSV